MIRKLMVVTLLLLLVSCSDEATKKTEENENEGITTSAEQTNNEKDHIPSQQTIEFTHNGQTFKIIPLYEEVLEYANQVIENPSIDRKEVYTEKVIKAFQDIAEEHEVNIGTSYFNFFSPNTTIERLKENSMYLLENQDETNNLIKEGLIASAGELPGVDKAIFVMPLNPDDYFTIQKMDGIGGVAFTEEVFLLTLDSTYKKEMLPYTVAHEYHHTVVFEKGPGVKDTVLDAIVIEGKADAFAEIIYPEVNTAWTEPMSEDSEKLVLDILKQNIDSRNISLYYELFNGNQDKGIPLWANYKIGLKFTQSYIKNNPEVPMKEWTNHSGKQIVEGSHYSDILNGS